MEFETLAVEEAEHGIVVVTVNRPDKLNALNVQVLTDLEACFDWIASTADVRAAVLTGAGRKAFVAGADISEFKSLSAAEARKFAERGQAVFTKIEHGTKPVVGAVNGYALGGGCELALSCHVRIASDNASFGQPEVNLGLIPGYGGTQRLPRVVGHGIAAEMILTGESISAQRAFEVGLVTRVVPQEELLDAARGLAIKIGRRAPVAVRLAYQALSRAYGTLTDGLSEEARLFGKAFETEDAREGVAAFLERRKPTFRGK